MMRCKPRAVTRGLFFILHSMSFILIKNNTAQVFRVTLTEKSITPGPSFFFTFKNEATREEVTLQLVDTSPCPARYNEFLIFPESIPGIGWVRYEARQHPGGSGAPIVEIGRCFLMTPSINFEEPNPSAEIFKHYEQ